MLRLHGRDANAGIVEAEHFGSSRVELNRGCHAGDYGASTTRANRLGQYPTVGDEMEASIFPIREVRDAFARPLGTRSGGAMADDFRPGRTPDAARRSSRTGEHNWRPGGWKNS